MVAPEAISKWKEGLGKMPSSAVLILDSWKGTYSHHKKKIAEGRIRGVVLLGGKKQQCISQYADDSSFMIKGEKKDVDELVKLLK